MSETRNIHQQLGEIRGSLTGLLQALRDLREDRARLEERITAENARTRDERRERDTEITAQLQLLNARIVEVSSDITQVKGDGVLAFSRMERVESRLSVLDNWKNRAIAYGLGLGSIFTVMIYFIGPLLQSLLLKMLKAS